MAESHILPANVYDRDSIRQLSPSSRTIDLACDVVIVGSGAGGATAAAEFAEAGYSTIVIEEGHYYRTEEFNGNSSDMVRKMYRGGGATMALGSPVVMYQEGCVVGGSTTINGGMSYRTPEEILRRWSSEAHIEHLTAKDMEPYFERVERRIHVRTQDSESIGRDNELLKEAAQSLGWDVVENPRNQVHCPGSNNCAFGCPTGAKQSALVSYLPRALHFGAQLLSDVHVDTITRSGKRATGVKGHVRLADGSKGSIVTVRAKLVLSACGAIHTPALLHRSGFRSPSGLLGNNLSLHPNCKLVAIFDEPIRGWEGVHQAYQVREFHDRGFIFAAVNIPPSIIAMGAPMFGQELGDYMAMYDRMMVAGLLMEDTSLGSVRVMPGGPPQAFYQLNDADAQRLREGTALLAELLFEAGARRVLSPFSGIPELRNVDAARKLATQTIPKSTMELVTVHLMGTASMGKERSRSVTDMYGFVHDTEGLMVADASLFPSAVGVNPMETIQALTTRNVHHVLLHPKRWLT